MRWQYISVRHFLRCGLGSAVWLYLSCGWAAKPELVPAIEQALSCHQPQQAQTLMNQLSVDQNEISSSEYSLLQAQLDIAQGKAKQAYKNLTAQLAQPDLNDETRRSIRIWQAAAAVESHATQRAQNLLYDLERTYPGSPLIRYWVLRLKLLQLDLTNPKILYALQERANRLADDATYLTDLQWLSGLISFVNRDYIRSEQHLERVLEVCPQRRVVRKMLALTDLRQKQAARAVQHLYPNAADMEMEEDQQITLLRWLACWEISCSNSPLLPKAFSPTRSLERQLLEPEPTDSIFAAFAEQVFSKFTEFSLIHHIQLIQNALYKNAKNPAIKQADLLVKQFPNLPLANNLQADILRYFRDLEGASKIYKRILKQWPQDIGARIGLAAIAAQEKQPQVAQQYYREILQINPSHLRAQLYLAEHLDNVQEQEKVLLTAHQQYPQDLDLGLLLVRFYLEQRHYSNAAAIAEKLHALYSQDIRVTLAYASVLLAQDQISKAKEVASLALQQDPLHLDAQLLMVNILAREQKIEEAITLLQKAFYQYPTDPRVLITGIQLGLRNDRLAFAKQWVATYQQAYPQETKAYDLLYRWARRQQQWQEALTAYQQIVVIDPQQRDEKELAYLQALVSDLDAEQPWKKDLAQAMLAHQNGDLAAAQRAYLKVLTQDPNQITALNNLAYLFVAENPAVALDYASRAWRADPSPEVTDTYAYVLLHNQQPQQAYELLQPLLQAQPENLDFAYHLALAQWQLGQRKEAATRLHSLLKEKSFIHSEEAQQLLDQLGK